MTDNLELIKSCEKLQEWIIESEMEGHVDKDDPFYPILINLDELRGKIQEDCIESDEN